jgi:hypothetical protein
MRSRPTILALLTTLAVPAITYAEPPRPEPDEAQAGRYEEPLFVAGTVTFLTSYGLSFGIAASTLDRDNRGLYVPVAGPWIALAANHPCEGGCADDTRDDVLLVLDGVAQAAGVALMATSLVRSVRAEAHDAHLVITSRSVGIAARF